MCVLYSLKVLSSVYYYTILPQSGQTAGPSVGHLAFNRQTLQSAPLNMNLFVQEGNLYFNGHFNCTVLWSQQKNSI